MNNINRDIVFWNVDTQHDFMDTSGLLPVENATDIRSNLTSLTALADQYSIGVVNTADWHRDGDTEIDAVEPDFVHTYSPHCLANTRGASFVPETSPNRAYVVDWTDRAVNTELLVQERNTIIYKNEFDVFAGNSHTEQIVNALNPKRAIVYGVATNVCVDKAVKGLLERGIAVSYVTDAIKHLPHLDEMNHPLYKGLEATLTEWNELGAEKTTVADLREDLRGYV